MKFTVFLVILSLSGLEGAEYNLRTLPDFITDLALFGVKDYMNKHNETMVLIPQVEMDFVKYGLRGEFIANGGVFRNPATVEREGHSNIVHGDKKYLLEFTIGFKTMTIYFSDYTAKIPLLPFLKESGEIYVVVGKNALDLQLTVVYSPKCIITLNEVKMTDFDDLAVSITGLGVLNTLEAQIVQKILAAYKDSFTPLIESVVNAKLQEAFQNSSLCKFKPT